MVGQAATLSWSALPVTRGIAPLRLIRVGVTVLTCTIVAAGLLLTVAIAATTNQTLTGLDRIGAELGAIIDTDVVGATLTVVTTIRCT